MGVLKTEEVASLYRRYAGMVYQIGLMLLKNAPDAEDAVQTVFRRAMERDEPFGGPDHERAWLIVTARNECKNQLRHWWRTRRADGTELDNLTWEQPGDGELWELILTLPEHEKMALYLHYYQGYGLREIARLLGVTVPTVKMRLKRGREALRKELL